MGGSCVVTLVTTHKRTTCLLNLTMRSTSIVALIAALAAPLAQGAPATNAVVLQGGEAHTSAGWTYDNCGASSHVLNDQSMWISAQHVLDTDILAPIGSPDDFVQVKSIKVSPDPPVPGQDLTVFAEGTVRERVEVGPPGC